jgi:hypothetical protein
MSNDSIPRWFPIMFAWVGLTLAGCGSDEVELATVSGTVTMNDEPLPGATVLFRPQTTEDDSEAKVAAESFGKTDENCRFEIQFVIIGEKGAVVGKNSVVITLDAFEEILPSIDSSGKDSRGPNPIPPEYNSKTTLEIEVPAEGSKNADLKLINPEFKVPDQKANPDQDA